MELPPPAVDLRRLAVGRVGDEWGERSVPEEVAISLTYNRDSHAVMMATPLDLEDFGVGFSLNEGLIGRISELTEIEVCRHDLGLELRMSLGGEATERTLERRRRLAGVAGDARVTEPQRGELRFGFHSPRVARNGPGTLI